LCARCIPPLCGAALRFRESRYVDGRGVPRNAGEALRLLRAAAAGGDPGAQHARALAELILADEDELSDGDAEAGPAGRAAREAEALRLFLVAGARGEGRAAHNAGVCKRLGIGCAADAREARALLEHARGLLARRERDRPAAGLLEGVYGPASEQHAPLTVDAAGLGGAGPAEAARAGGEAAAAAVQLAEMLLAGEGAQARALARAAHARAAAPHAPCSPCGTNVSGCREAHAAVGGGARAGRGVAGGGDGGGAGAAALGGRGRLARRRPAARVALRRAGRRAAAGLPPSRPAALPPRRPPAPPPRAGCRLRIRAAMPGVKALCLGPPRERDGPASGA